MYIKIFINHRTFLLIVLLITSCKFDNETKEYQDKLEVMLVNESATFNTVNLFFNLKKLAKSEIIFGHHHATAYGVKWKEAENRSDVKDVTGSHPGMIGWDFGDFIKIGDEKCAKLKSLVIEANNKGIINTFSWHYPNPVSNKSFYDTTIVVKHLLPGGSHNTQYNKDLDRIANFTKHLIGSNNKVIPIIFRPFHEMDGSWFWWGKNFCNPEEFKSLWQYTVEYLKDYRNVRNILFAFSPDRNFYNEEDYLERYPGDEYVDILGMDNYYDFTPDGDGLEAIKSKLIVLSKMSEQKSKIAAFTETGLEAIPDSKWWTEKLLYVIGDDSINISYVMVWRNATHDHFYAPYEGHSSSSDFIKFKNNHYILFQDELPNMFE